MRRRDFIQNLIITLLTMSALVLFSRTQFFELVAAAGSGAWQRLTVPASSSAGNAPLSNGLSAPVRTAVTGEYGRYGSVSLTTGSETFTPVKTLLREALGSARSPAYTTQTVFQAALETPSVYCDFLAPLPVSYLADLMGVTLESELSARCLIAAEQNEQVILLLWDGAHTYVQYATAAQSSALMETLTHFELGVSTFAFEETGGAHFLSPFSLFPDPLPELPQLTVGDTANSTDTLLTALGLNPHTNSRYQDAGGAEVIVEGEQVVRISADGAFTYTSGGESTLSIAPAGAAPTPQSAVSGALSLLERLVSPGDAQLYLTGWTQSGQETVLTFDYQISGVPILSADGSPAAEVTLFENTVSTLSLRSRQYLAGESVSLLLPLRQAIAIAGQQTGTELFIGYADTGAEPLSAAWLMD